MPTNHFIIRDTDGEENARVTFEREEGSHMGEITDITGDEVTVALIEKRLEEPVLASVYVGEGPHPDNYFWLDQALDNFAKSHDTLKDRVEVTKPYPEAPWDPAPEGMIR